MKGLLRKDFYMLKYCRNALFISAVFFVVSIFSDRMDFFLIYPCVIVSMLPIMLFSYDERERWNDYVQTCPLSRSAYVTERYLFGVLCVCVSLLLLLVCYLFSAGLGRENPPLGELLPTILVMGLICPAVLLPFLFRFGVEKGRLAMYVVFGLVLGVVVLFFISDDGDVPALPLARPVSGAAICLAALLCYVLSWRLSVALYQNREL